MVGEGQPAADSSPQCAPPAIRYAKAAGCFMHPQGALLKALQHPRHLGSAPRALFSAKGLVRIIQFGPICNHVCKLDESLNARAV
jgi:hypothetical protein